MPVITPTIRWAPALLCALAFCTPYKLQPEPIVVTAPTGVTVSPHVDGNQVVLDVGNRSARPIFMEPADVRLSELFGDDGDANTFAPINPEPGAVLRPGEQRKFKLSFDTDIDSPDETQVYSLRLNLVLALRKNGAGPLPIKLVPRLLTHWEPERTHLSILGGFGYDYLYGASFLSGFGELRVGGRHDRVEVTGRLRIQPGQTLSGLTFVHLSLGLGVLFVVQQRVRVGFALSLPPSFLYVEGHSGGMAALKYDVHAELLVDLVQGVNGALFASTRFGVTGDLLGSSHPYLIGPSMLTGLGYRLR